MMVIVSCDVAVAAGTLSIVMMFGGNIGIVGDKFWHVVLGKRSEELIYE